MTTQLVQATKQALIGNLEELLQAIKTLAEPLSQDQFWRKPIDPGNSFGHLVLHLSGNLKHFAGAQLGNTGYVRDREREFTEADLPSKTAALVGLDEAVAVYRKVVEELPAEKFASAHPDAKMGSVIHGLVRMLAHFALHRGQMSYIARMVQQ